MKNLKLNLQGLDHATLWNVAELIVNKQLDLQRIQDIEKEAFDELVSTVVDDLIKLQD